MNKSLRRSLMQVIGLCFAAWVLSATAVQAQEYTFSCEEQAAQCASQCGTTVTSTFLWAFWHTWWYNGVQYGAWAAVHNFAFPSGVEVFECDPVTGERLCMCAI
ncbi:MAG: hypothetical protein SH850_24460 [Planctomycetaceae bacterium]|nr:hypothetical protein [Planctomycetaceae bacterium]